MIEYAIRARLLAVSAVTDIVSAGDLARVYPLRLPQVPKFPAITYQVISGTPAYDMEGDAGVKDVRIQVDCWAHDDGKADRYDVCRTLAEAVEEALSGWTGTLASETVQSLFLASGPHMTYEAEAQLFRARLDFEVGYST